MYYKDIGSRAENVPQMKYRMPTKRYSYGATGSDQSENSFFSRLQSAFTGPNAWIYIAIIIAIIVIIVMGFMWYNKKDKFEPFQYY
jgi:hypothetical protein